MAIGDFKCSDKRRTEFSKVHDKLQNIVAKQERQKSNIILGTVETLGIQDSIDIKKRQYVSHALY